MTPIPPRRSFRRFTAIGTLLALALLSGLSPDAQARFDATAPAKPSPNTVYFRMTESIFPGDANKLQALLNEKKVEPGKTNVWVHMDSHGGDVGEAMRIGRILRKYKAFASHGKCVGSCVFAFMGASMRYYTSPKPHVEMSPLPIDPTGLWVFEPYVMAKMVPLSKTNPAIAKALDDVRAYTIEMTGKPNFYLSVIKIPYDKPVRMSRNNVFDMNVGSLEANGLTPNKSMPVGDKLQGW